MELLQTLVDALREGLISPVAFVVIVVLGLLVWGAAKLGDKLFSNVGNLIDVGDQVRKSLTDQLAASDARALRFQQAADLANQRAELTAADLAALTIRYQTANTEVTRLAALLLETQREAQDLRDRLGRIPGTAA